MSVRYIFNTDGDYVAFVSGKNLWSPNSEWLGFIPHGNLVYSTKGKFLGEITQDDRIVRNETQTYHPMLVPLRPLKPLRPLRPLKRLRMLRLPRPYTDVFESGVHMIEIKNELIEKFGHIVGAAIYGGDPNNTFLGSINNNRFDQKSILNQFSPYGSKYSQTSIFNDYCPFGGQYGIYSPYNPYSINPPRIYSGSTLLGFLTLNSNIRGNTFDPNEFAQWLGSI
jgi:hypothetical protein